MPGLSRFDRDLPRHGLRGVVVAVHRSAAVVRLDDPGSLLTLLLPHRSVLPWSVVVPALPFPGDEVEIRERRLLLGGRGLTLLGEGVDLGVPLLPPACWGGVGPQVRDLALPPPVEEVGLRYGDAVMRFQQTQDPRHLSGLGEGSTPAGDDLLLGMAAMRSRLVEPRWGALQIPLSTTETAACMLRHGARGRFPEPLAAWARGVGDPSVNLGHRVTPVLSLGAGSGAAMLAGCLAFLSRWIPEHER